MSSNADLPGKSNAQTYRSNAERDIADINGINLNLPIHPIHNAAVVGAGDMGTGIAMAFANVGIPVLLKEASHELLDKAFAAIAESYERLIRKGRLSEAQVSHRLDMIRPAFNYERLSGADFVVEAVPENLSLKQEIFAQLDTVVGPDTILATGTSTLDIDAIASASTKPSRVIGFHFPAPANVARLVEIVRGRATSGEVVASAFALAGSLNKTGVVVGNCRGFAGIRMYLPYLREAQFLAEEGARIEEIDGILHNFGMAMGPFAAMDESGLDVTWQVQRDMAEAAASVEAEAAEARRTSVIERLCRQGRLGKKTGAGWYRYAKNSQEPRPDPDAETIIEALARENGIRRRTIASEEILERTIYALVNEGARILEEKIVRRAAALDIIFTAGYGFPDGRGGPMWFADEVGLGVVRKRICEFEQQYGLRWQPARLLETLADEGKRFADFAADLMDRS
jgi:3-hydroxyacyl-CoA dehydrogenase